MAEPVVTGVVGPSQPDVFFDLLPTTAKNPSFVVRFDVEIPRPRFVIAHRTVISSYAQLTLDDRRELVRAAMDFSKKMNLHACSVSVPMGRMCRNTSDARFFAYLNVPDQQSFLNLYLSLEHQIPSWNLPSWRTEHWPERRTVDEATRETYQFGLREFSSGSMMEPEVLLAPLGVEVPYVSVRGSRMNTSFVLDCESSVTDDLQLTLHSSLPLVGLSYIGTRPKMPAENRWELLDAMHDLLHEHVNLDHRGCFMSISLSDSFMFDDLKNVIGLMRFIDVIPISLSIFVRSLQKRKRNTSNTEKVNVHSAETLDYPAEPAAFVRTLSQQRAVSADDLRDFSGNDEIYLKPKKLHSSCLELYNHPQKSGRGRKSSKSLSRTKPKKGRRAFSCQNNVM